MRTKQCDAAFCVVNGAHETHPRSHLQHDRVMDPANCIADFLHIKTPKSLSPQLVEAATFEGGHEGLLIQGSTNVGRPHLFPTQSVGKSLRTP